MSERFVSVMMLLVAAIHILPLSGVAGIGQLSSLYNVEITGGDLEILMRHRAVLLGLLGVLFVYAAFKPVIQPVVFFIAFTSIVSFLYLAFSVDDFNVAIRKVVYADIVALVALLVA